MQALKLFETVAALSPDGKGYRIQHPHTDRWITIPEADLSSILDLVPTEIISAYQASSAQATRMAFIDAVLTARLNKRLLSRWIPKGGTVSLPAEKLDPPRGYYYPEKGKTAYFKAHGRISVDPDLMVPILDPSAKLLEKLEEARRQYADEPFTALTIIGHGVFTYLFQAKRLNGQKYLFGKLIHHGSQPVEMTHWARVSGWDSGTLIKRSGIDLKQL
ncbi:MAG: hypothetical protein COS92_03630 [Desulfobacterales bacterium CG07_land_8_20_14_0_80_52_14]|nr:MAG: hypothetical protein COX20_05645 [Desulfobacterales bacterium CG23_combo_of_CG06-09_8_20_14_all_52_9]PIU50008.1 MAG: hypothetical protein COS92_03630 [Desulfobacterales bacterium CG07_land_8_20_14_0_80_52_14]